MADEYNKELCEEKHKNLDQKISSSEEKIEKDISALKNKMWWFVTMAIGSLIGMILNFIKDMVVR